MPKVYNTITAWSIPKDAIYCGRKNGGFLGNPFIISNVGSINIITVYGGNHQISSRNWFSSNHKVTR